MGSSSQECELCSQLLGRCAAALKAAGSAYCPDSCMESVQRGQEGALGADLARIQEGKNLSNKTRVSSSELPSQHHSEMSVHPHPIWESGNSGPLHLCLPAQCLSFPHL